MNDHFPLLLRPHHSLCICFFKGEGYSNTFTASMARIIQTLEKENPLIQLTNNCDIICSSCPENRGGICRTSEKVSGIDRRCMAEYHTAYGDILHWHDLKLLAHERIIDCGKLSDVCQSCRWSDLCF